MIVSNEPWGDIWFSKHHYASELSRYHQVIFINPPVKWRFGNLFNRKIELLTINENLKVLNYQNFLPHYFLRFNNFIVSKRISNFLVANRIIPDIFWTFDPMRLFDPKYFKVKKSLFHVVDKYHFNHPAERKLHKNVDAFVSVSKDFVSQYTIYGKPIIVIPHGLSVDEFEVNHQNFELNEKDFILYVGNIDKRLDFAFIADILQKFSNEKFLFVGGMKNVEDENYKRIFIDRIYPNLIYVPPVHAKNLKYFIDKSKCCIAPMWKGLDGNLISHHKILQYMAHGKAIFSPVFTEYSEFNEYLYMQNDWKELMNSMDKFLKEGEADSLANKRKEIARTHEYSFHIEKIIALLDS